MSETIKPVEAARKFQDTTVRATREATGRTEAMAEAMTDSARHAEREIHVSTDEAVRASERVASSGQDMLAMGMRTAAGIGGRVADMGYDRSHNMLSSMVQAMDIYANAAEHSAERVQALVSSGITLGRGLQRMQHAWLEMLDRSLQKATHRPQDLLRAKTLVEMAEVQRDLYADAVNHAFDSSTRLLQMASQAAQDAARPLQSRQH